MATTADFSWPKVRTFSWPRTNGQNGRPMRKIVPARGDPSPTGTWTQQRFCSRHSVRSLNRNSEFVGDIADAFDRGIEGRRDLVNRHPIGQQGGHEVLAELPPRLEYFDDLQFGANGCIGRR